MFPDISFADFNGERVVHEQSLNEGIEVAQATFFDVMQFTGLHDKNGKEIYEGDVVKNWRDEKLCPVEWGTDGWMVRTSKQTSEHLKSYFYPQNGEVIGNIYENPELLKQHDTNIN